MQSLPTGTITLLFTDIEGSTRLWEDQPDTMAAALVDHDAILAGAVESCGGVVFKTVGDAFHAAFQDAADAVACALSVQQRLGESAAPFAVRIAVHCGEPQVRGQDYFGPAVNRVARILSAAHGGQILLSAAVIRLTRGRFPEGTWLVEHGAHRLKDLAEPEELFQLGHPCLRLDFPPLRSLTSHSHNLPAQLTSFVGRETELREIDALLESGARLVTLTGVGGAGKTRIALQVAAENIEHYPGGVWWADLSAVRDSGRVLPEIAAALGLVEESGRPLYSQIADRLSESRTLLGIDNFEQVIDAGLELAGLLRAIPSLQALVTSRAPLNVSGEHDYAVPEMSLSEAVALFTSRAQLVQARFEVDSTSLPVIETICRRLDGIPLAIELAAAQSRVLSVAQIERQLDRRFRTLVSPYRDVSQRQRTLRSTVDWSYDLLADEDKRLFASLSVFVGGFTFEAAEAVADGNEVFVGIARLREQSLLAMDDSAAVPRFRMLETLREYGQEKLCGRGDGESLRGRHAALFANLAAAEDARVETEGGGRASAEIACDYDNVRTSLSWLVDSGRADDAYRMACSLGRFWEARGQLREARELLRQCLEGKTPPTDRRLLARLLGWAGWFADLQGDLDESERLQATSLAICREAGDRSGEGRALNHLALTAANRRRFDEARVLYEQSLCVARQLGDRSAQAARLNNLALLAIEESRTEDASRQLAEALDIYAAIGDSHGIAACHCNLGELALKTETWDSAQVHLQEALARFTRLEEVRGVAACLGSLAEIHLNKGDIESAEERLREALAICLETGMLQDVPSFLECFANASLCAVREDAAALALCVAARVQREFQRDPVTPDIERECVVSAEARERAESTVQSRSVEESIRVVLNLSPLIAADQRALLTDKYQPDSEALQ